MLYLETLVLKLQYLHEQRDNVNYMQKQPSRDVLKKRYSEKLQKMYRRTPMGVFSVGREIKFSVRYFEILREIWSGNGIFNTRRCQ